MSNNGKHETPPIPIVGQLRRVYQVVGISPLTGIMQMRPVFRTQERAQRVAKQLAAANRENDEAGMYVVLPLDIAEDEKD